jgi:hypothetical protein
MTRPSFVGFVWDTPGGEPKIFLRTMLYATGKRGYIVNALYLKVFNSGGEHIFSFWTVKTENPMTIGSGLKVDENGVSADFHFLPPKEAHNFQFVEGEYDISVIAGVVNQKSSLLLWKLKLALSQEQAKAMRPNMLNGVFFNWQPEQGSYHSYIEARTAIY